MYHATTTDIPYRDPVAHKVGYCLIGACLPLLGLLLEAQANAQWRLPDDLEDMVILAFVTLAMLVVCGGTLLSVFKFRVRVEGTTHRGRIESKLGEGFPLEVVWGRLHAVPFVVRLEDGRAALVEPVSLALETDVKDQEIDVGAQIEIIGSPRWTADAPMSVYRESTVMCFAGTPSSPVGIRVTD